MLRNPADDNTGHIHNEERAIAFYLKIITFFTYSDHHFVMQVGLSIARRI